jgi:nanoRNase/pAp phosphatase (c-di-AMP/oligoRNAs hydrolase)
MKLSSSERLQQFYSRFTGDDHVLVVINADPDAIASAMAVKRLLWRKTASVTLASINIVQRPDNLAMIKLLKIDLRHMHGLDRTRFSRFVIVDSQPHHHEAFAKIDFDVVIDHHPGRNGKAPFSDIRPEYGATASILTQYLKAAKIKPASRLATALFYAIKTDTDNFKRKTIIEDVRAFQFLFRNTNNHLIRKIEQAELRLDFLKYFKTALQNKKILKGKLFVHLGPVTTPDVCVLIADFFMRIDSIDWSIVSGMHAKKLIVIFRSDGIRKNAGKLAKAGFDQIGSAGGHKSMARAEITSAELKKFVNPQESKKLQQWIIRRLIPKK